MAGTARSPWLVSPSWDAFWLLSGAWLLAIVACAQALGRAASLLAVAQPALLFFVWGAHDMSPSVSCWSVRGTREALLRNKGPFIYRPLALLVLSMGAFAASQWLRETRPDAFRASLWKPHFLILLLYFVASTRHFAVQHFGVLSLYRRRLGRDGDRDWTVDRAYALVIAAVLLPCAWLLQPVRGELEPFYLLFHRAPGPTGFWGWAVIAADAAVVAAMAVYELTRERRSLPRLLYLGIIGVQPALSVLWYSFYNFPLYALAHYLVEIGLTSRILNSPLEGPLPGEPASFSGTWRGAAVRVALLLGLGAIWYAVLFKFALVPYLVRGHALAAGAAWTPERAIRVARLYRSAFAGAFFGSAFNHFTYSRYAYLFRKPEIRENMAPRLGLAAA